MSSITRDDPHENPTGHGLSAEDPLLGRRGDASQPEGHGIYNNLFLGTAILAQAGVWILVATIWASVLSHKVILFSAHPLLNSAGLFFSIQAILILQPTHTPHQKQLGTHIHAALNTTALLSFIAALVIIEYNKIDHNGTHFQSPHAVFGLITYLLVFIQALVGIAQFYIPGIFGGVDNAKAIYKYHRATGYVIIVLALITVAAATQTDYNKNLLHIRLWAVLLAGLLTLAGLIPRIKRQKLGL